MQALPPRSVAIQIFLDRVVVFYSVVLCSIAKSCPTLFNLMDRSSSVYGISQARILECCSMTLWGWGGGQRAVRGTAGRAAEPPGRPPRACTYLQVLPAGRDGPVAFLQGRGEEAQSGPAGGGSRHPAPLPAHPASPASCPRYGGAWAWWGDTSPGHEAAW